MHLREKTVQHDLTFISFGNEEWELSCSHYGNLNLHLLESIYAVCRRLWVYFKSNIKHEFLPPKRNSPDGPLVSSLNCSILCIHT